MNDSAPSPHNPDRLDRAGYTMVFAEDFCGATLDAAKWIDHYLPEWTTPERSMARYQLTGGRLRLLIEADQPAWRPEDGSLRVSSLQTGTFSGPPDSIEGQMRHRDDLRVRSPQPTAQLWTPSAGLVEAKVRASPDPTCMLAVWLVGHRAGSPCDSGEILLCELYGNLIGPGRSTVRLGVKAHADPRLHDDITDLPLDLDATEAHTYAATWDSHHTRFFVDGFLVHTVPQGLDYPVQLMVDLFEFPTTSRRDPAAYPKSAEVFAVRGYEPR